MPVARKGIEMATNAIGGGQQVGGAGATIGGQRQELDVGKRIQQTKDALATGNNREAVATLLAGPIAEIFVELGKTDLRRLAQGLVGDPSISADVKQVLLADMAKHLSPDELSRAVMMFRRTDPALAADLMTAAETQMDAVHKSEFYGLVATRMAPGQALDLLETLSKGDAHSRAAAEELGIAMAKHYSPEDKKALLNELSARVGHAGNQASVPMLKTIAQLQIHEDEPAIPASISDWQPAAEERQPAEILQGTQATLEELAADAATILGMAMPPGLLPVQHP
jgi:hypothetical protein